MATTGINGWNGEIESLFHNYWISFHNELWASVFSGKFAAGTTWHWERVFWWEDALAVPPEDLDNDFQPNGVFSNVPGADNRLDIGVGSPGIEVVVKNRKIHHHFQPLAELLSHAGVADLGIFDGNFSPHAFFDSSSSDPNPIECYYLKNSDNSTAIGWVHNRNASVAKSFYVNKGSGVYNNFLGSLAPTVQGISLPGFLPGQDYYVYWFPTRMNATTTDLPTDYTDEVDDGQVLLDFSSMPLGGTLNNYLDTLHADYAFVISPAPIVKSLTPASTESLPKKSEWDFVLFPNPTRDGAWLRFEDNSPKEIVVYDAIGRRMAQASAVNGMMYYLDLRTEATGLYWVRVSDGIHTKARRLLIQ